MTVEALDQTLDRHPSTGAASGRPQWLVRSLAGIVLVGSALRGLQYVARSSLSGDEAFLALNLIERDLGNLFSQLHFNQVAPSLFLLLDNAAIELVGRGELAVRLVPFLASIIALAAFAVLAARTLPPVGAIVATVLLAASEPAITWAAVGKQYSSDAMATVVVGLAAVQVARAPGGRRDVAILAVTGAGAVWLSFPVAFVLAGVGSALLIQAVSRRDLRSTGWLLLAAAGWGVSFVVSYRQSSSGIEYLQGSLGLGSADTGGGSPLEGLPGVIRYITGTPHLELAGVDAGELVTLALIALAAFGAVTLLRRNLVVAAIVALPFAFGLAASALEQYPLLPRAALWAVPPLCLLAGAGIGSVITARPPGTARTTLAVGLGVVVGAVAAPAFGHVVEPRTTQQMRPLLQELAPRLRPGDAVFVLYSAQYGLRWYLGCDCAGNAVRRASAAGLLPLSPAPGGADQWAPALRSKPPSFLVGTYVRSGDGEDYAAQLDGLAGRTRVWVMLSNIDDELRGEILGALDGRGNRSLTLRAGGDEGAAEAYLYDFRAPSSQS